MSIRRLVGAATLGAIAPLLVVSTPSLALQTGSSSVTAHASDYTPASGQTFVVRGRYTLDSLPASGHAVKLQALRDGNWENLKGVRVKADVTGKYRLRVILSTIGVRQLRAVGIAGDGHRNSYDRFEVEVH